MLSEVGFHDFVQKGFGYRIELNGTLAAYTAELITT
jgi:hypothetical protein